MESKKILIVGGGGFVGENLCLALAKQNNTVFIIDKSPLAKNIVSLKNVSFKIADILDTDQLNKIAAEFQPNLLIHLASWGMSGSSMLSRKCRNINIKGTQSALTCCLLNNIERMIYVSSYNVVFGGKEIINGDETLPYFPLDEHSDQYSPSKAIAEQLVLQANGQLTVSGKTLITTSLRPAAIYGEGEKRHLPRIVEHIDSGLFLFRISKATVDWVYIDNLVDAFVLLIDKLYTIKQSSESPGGQSYFISDGTPVDNFDFLRPLCLVRKKPFPSLILPLNFALVLAFMMENIYHISNFLKFPIEPMLTRAEVLKVGVSHYFSIKKAKNDFNYDPKITSQEGAIRIRKFYENISNENYFELAGIYGWLFSIVGLINLFFVSFLETQKLNYLLSAPLFYVELVGLKIFQSHENLQIIFYSAIFIHVLESLYVLNLSKNKLKCKNTWKLWVLQTFLIGFPSLLLLEARVKLMAEKDRRK